MTPQEEKTLREKAEKLDKIQAIMDEAYATDDSGEFYDDSKDLVWIGERVAMIMGCL